MTRCRWREDGIEVCPPRTGKTPRARAGRRDEHVLTDDLEGSRLRSGRGLGEEPGQSFRQAGAAFSPATRRWPTGEGRLRDVGVTGIITWRRGDSIAVCRRRCSLEDPGRLADILTRWRRRVAPVRTFTGSGCDSCLNREYDVPSASVEGCSGHPLA
jgi:hypothetical protein